jgi:hypothetical protein
MVNVFQVDKPDRVNCNIIRAKWVKSGYELAIDPSENFARAGLIKNIFITRHRNGGISSHLVLLEVEWFTMHDNTYVFGQRVHMYHRNTCAAGNFSLMPIQRVISKCALHICEHENIQVSILIPLAGQWCL